MHEHGGIIFYQTTNLKRLQKFYTEKVGAALWLDQGGCRIYRFGNMLFGFCQREKNETGALLTFFYPTRELVDEIYRRLKDLAEAPPKDNASYRIYHFYAKDPDGRAIEFQYFWDDIDEIK
ncbi:MAG: VOC family protein [Bacteroidota bacterium]|nr:VOC family protein [Bacteroidota bacterium]